jgi:hypothetical protein
MHIQGRQKPPQHTYMYINALVNQFYHYLLLKMWFTAVALLDVHKDKTKQNIYHCIEFHLFMKKKESNG